jgi:hypothetical protein
VYNDVRGDEMSLKDRGTKKWASSFMMPEHMGMLRKAWRDDEKVKRPILDEDKIEQIERTICEAMESNETLAFTIWRDGYFQTFTGRVHYIDAINKHFRLKDENSTLQIVPFEYVVNVTV